MFERPLNIKVRYRVHSCRFSTDSHPGQKCSALSRLYVSRSVWENGFKTQFLQEIAKIRVGPCLDWGNYVGPVMCVNTYSLSPPADVGRCSGRRAYDNITGFIKKAKEEGGEVLIGGTGNLAYFFCRRQFDQLTVHQGDDSKGFFIQPTVILTKDPRSTTMVGEIFGPVVTVCFVRACSCPGVLLRTVRPLSSRTVTTRRPSS